MHLVPASVQNYQKLISKIQTSSELNISQHHQNTNTAEACVPESQPDNTGGLILSLPTPGRVYDVLLSIYESGRIQLHVKCKLESVSKR